MTIIVSKNNKDAKRIEELSFKYEDNMQEYILNNPDVIPLYEIDEGIKLFIAAREFQTASGPIDALGFDKLGNIYVIETKLFKNPGKREVVAQALDYGASLWRHATDFSVFIEKLDENTERNFKKLFKNKLKDVFEIEDVQEIIDNIQNNLSSGQIKFVVLMDKLHDQLKDLVIFINQNSKFDLYAVELEYYKHDEFEIIIPKLYGSEVKKDVSLQKSGRKWCENDFLETLNSNLKGKSLTALNKLYQWAKEHADTITYGTGRLSPAATPKFNRICPRSFITIKADGSIPVNYGFLRDDKLCHHLLSTLQDHHIDVDLVTKNLRKPDLVEYYPIIPVDYVANNVDKIIAALDEFIKHESDINE